MKRCLVTIVASGAILSLFLFPTSTAGEKIAQPDTRIASRNRAGVTAPSNIGPKGSTAKQTTKAPSNSETKHTAGSMPNQSKPSWTHMPLFVDPTNGAAEYLSANPEANGKEYLTRMAQMPVAQWFGDWNQNITNDVRAYVSAAAAKGSIPVLVFYNIPNRDCGGYSIGGASNQASYTQWIQQAASAIGNYPAVVILEPDALGALSCLPTARQPERTQSIAEAVKILKNNSKTAVYIDAGTPVWQPADVMATRLKAANVSLADGFSLNVSYFATTALNYSYGDKLSSLIGYKHYVIDTSRNGGGHDVAYMQCNPSFAALGEAPTTNTSSKLSDALLWIKIPWESDGDCNGSPGPGEPYWEYAINLARNAGW